VKELKSLFEPVRERVVVVGCSHCPLCHHHACPRCNRAFLCSRRQGCGCLAWDSLWDYYRLRARSPRMSCPGCALALDSVVVPGGLASMRSIAVNRESIGARCLGTVQPSISTMRGYGEGTRDVRRACSPLTWTAPATATAPTARRECILAGGTMTADLRPIPSWQGGSRCKGEIIS